MKSLACTFFLWYSGSHGPFIKYGGKEQGETHDVLLVAIIETIRPETRLEVYLHGIDRYSASRQETENRGWRTKSARRLIVMTRCWIYSQRSLGLTMAPFTATKLSQCTCLDSRTPTVMHVTLSIQWTSRVTLLNLSFNRRETHSGL